MRRRVEMSLPTGLRFVVVASLMSLTRLSDLATDLLTLVANALGLVRVGLAQLADVGRDLTDELLVDAADREPGGRLHLEGDAVRRGDLDGVAVPQRELQLRALQLDAVTDAVDLELLHVAVGDTDDDVAHQRAGQAVQRTVLPLVVRPLHRQRAVLGALDGDRLDHDVLQGALRALDVDGLAVDVDVDPRGDGDRQLSDTGHALSPPRAHQT